MNQEFKFLMYRAADEDISVNAVIKDETIWLTQKAMANLFDVTTKTISEHLTNIYDSGELDKNRTIRNCRIVQLEGIRQVTREQSFKKHFRGGRAF